MDEIDPPFIGRCHKPAHIADHAAAKVDKQAFAVGPKVDQHFPYTDAEVDVLAFFPGIDLDDIEIIFSFKKRLYLRQAMNGGVFIGQLQKTWNNRPGLQTCSIPPGCFQKK